MHAQKLQVYGLGNAIVDLQVAISEHEFTALGLTKGTMNLVDLAAQSDLLSRFRSHDVVQKSGGSAANTIIGLAQLGAKTAYGCVIADDAYGRHYLQELGDLQVVTHIQPVSGEVTGTSVILITPDTERTMNTHLGVSSTLGPEHVDENILSRAEWLYLEGYLFSSEPGLAAIRHSVELAKRSGVKIAVTCSDTFVVDVFNEALREILSQADLLFANLLEGRHLTSSTEDEAVFDALCRIVPNVALTLSERGALVKFEDQIARVNGFKIKPVDATGAGDMFAAGFLYGITHGLDAEHSANLACFLASRVVAQLGPRLAGDVRELAVTGGVLVQ